MWVAILCLFLFFPLGMTLSFLWFINPFYSNFEDCKGSLFFENNQKKRIFAPCGSVVHIAADGRYRACGMAAFGWWQVFFRYVPG
ncbi:MAG: hypothetical protein K2I68_03300, partial [Bacteroidales bacterium]|nr:hypothetical protein [Bacteroidales bacterium]